MAKAVITAGGAGIGLAGNITTYAPFANADISNSATESRVQVTVRAAGTVTKLTLTLSANNRNASTCTFRKNTADGNQAVSIGAASGAGVFQDTASSDALTAGDKVAVKLVSGSAGSAWTCRAVGAMFAATTNTVTLISTHDPTGVTVAAVTRYCALTGVLALQTLETTSSNVQTDLGQSQTLQSAAIVVIANTRNAATVFTLRTNAADTALTVSVASSSGAGVFEDTANTAAVVTGDDLNWKIVGGGSSGTFTLNAIKVESESTTGKAQLLVHDAVGTAFSIASAFRFFALGGLITFSATESDAQQAAPEAVTLSELHVILSANTRASSTSFGVRKNTGIGTLQVVVAASTGAGVFTDVSHSDAIAATDLVNAYAATGTGSGGFTLSGLSLLGATGGGDQTITVAGSLTPAGALRREPAWRVSGATTPAGVLRRDFPKSLAGATPSAGALKRQPAKLAVGTQTPAGALTRQPAPVLRGTVTPVNTLAWRLTRSVTGALTPVGACTKALTRALASTCTPSGALTRFLTATRAVSGQVPGAGALRAVVQWLRGGTLALDGTLAPISIKSLTGTVGGSGALLQERASVLATEGAIGSVGTLVSSAALHLDAALLLTSALTLRPDLFVAHTLDPIGRLASQPVLSPSGAVDAQGAMSTEGSSVLVADGTIPAAGALRVLADKGIARTLGLDGTLGIRLDQRIEGFLASSGALLSWELAATLPGPNLVGPVGAVTWTLDGALLTSTIALQSALRAEVDTRLTGAITPVGTTAPQVAQGLTAAGVLTPSGALLPWEVVRVVYGNAVILTSTLRRQVAVALQRLVAPEGALLVQVTLGLAGVVGAVGTLAFTSVTTLLLTGLIGLAGTLTSTFAIIRGRIQLEARRLRGGGLDPRSLTGGGLSDREID